MYVVLLPNDEKHIICMGSNGTWDDNYYNDYNYYNYNDYNYYNYNYYNDYNYYNYNYGYNDYDYDYGYNYYNYNYYTPLVNNPWRFSSRDFSR
jgi:hypothetical protein